MDNYIKICEQLTSTETTLYDSAVLIKTILLTNTTSVDVTANITFDSAKILIAVPAGEYIILNSPILCETISAYGNGVTIHITGYIE